MDFMALFYHGNWRALNHHAACFMVNIHITWPFFPPVFLVKNAMESSCTAVSQIQLNKTCNVVTDYTSISTCIILLVSMSHKPTWAGRNLRVTIKSDWLMKASLSLMLALSPTGRALSARPARLVLRDYFFRVCTVCILCVRTYHVRNNYVT